MPHSAPVRNNDEHDTYRAAARHIPSPRMGGAPNTRARLQSPRTLTRQTYLAFPLPPVDEELRALARELAGRSRWLVFEEPTVPEAAVPEPAVPEPAVPEPAVPEPAATELTADTATPGGFVGTAVQGAYEIDESGRFTGHSFRNPEYRPSPHVVGMRLNLLDSVVWRALHGYVPAGYLADCLYRAELATSARAPADNRLRVTRNNTGQPVLTAFTSTKLITADWDHYQLVTGSTLLDGMQLGPVFLDLNPGTSLSLQILLHDLGQLTAARQCQQASPRLAFETME